MENELKAFISHSSKDKDYANELVVNLENEGIKCWIAPRDITLGIPYPAAIVEALNVCDLMIVIISINSINSKHVAREVERMDARDKTVIPVFIEKLRLIGELEYMISSKQRINAYDRESASVFTELRNFIKSKPTIQRNQAKNEHQEAAVDLNTRKTEAEQQFRIDEIKHKADQQLDSNFRIFSNKYDSHLYQSRKKLEDEFENFLTSSKRVFLIVGGSGTGKTNLLCHLASKKSESSIALIYNCSSTDLNLNGHIAADLSDEKITLPELAGGLKKGNYQLLLFFDALNEYRPNPADLLNQIYEQLLRPLESAELHMVMKVVITTRHEIWYRLKMNIPWSFEFYRPSTKTGLNDIEAEIGSFDNDELKGAYQNYKQHYGLQTEFSELSFQVKSFISDPLLLRLVAETHKSQAIPPKPKLKDVFRDYLMMHLHSPNIEEIVKLKETIIRKLVDEMYSMKTDEINLSLLSDEELRSQLADSDVKSPYIQLLDAGILIEKNEGGFFRENRKIRFTIERLFEFLLSEVIFPNDLYVTEENVTALKDEILKHPALNLWGATKVALTTKANDSVLLKLAESEDALISNIVVDALLSLNIENSMRVKNLLGVLLNSESHKRKRVAILTAYEIRNDEVLLEALITEASEVQLLATEYLTFLWANDRQVADKIIQNLRGKIKSGKFGLFLSSKEIKAFLLVSFVLSAKYTEDEKLTTFFKTSWYEILQSVSLDKKNIFLDGIINISIKLVTSALASNTSGIFNLKTVDEFFRMDKTSRMRLLELAKYTDSTLPFDEQAQELLFAFSKIDDGFIFTATRIVFNIQALFHWDNFQSFVIRLLNDGNHMSRTHVQVGLYNCFMVPEWISREKADFYNDIILEYFTQPPFKIILNNDRSAPDFVAFRIGFIESQLEDGNSQPLLEYLDHTIWQKEDPDFLPCLSDALANVGFHGSIEIVIDAIKSIFEKNLARRVPEVEEMIVSSLAKIRVFHPDEIDYLLENWWASGNDEHKRIVSKIREYRQEIPPGLVMASSMEKLTGMIMWRTPAMSYRLFGDLLLTRCIQCNSIAEALRLIIGEITQILGEK